MIESATPVTSPAARHVRSTIGILLGGTLAVAIWVASGLFVPAGLSGLSARLQALVTIFLGIFIEALPFLLAGALASSAIHLFVSDDRIRRLSPRSPVLAALTGSLLGLAFPVCECGSIPATRRLIAKGAPLPLAIAFVLAAPAVNPVVIASTWIAFGGRPEIVAGRVVLTVLVASLVALVVGLRTNPRAILSPAALAAVDAPDCAHDHDQSERRLRQLLHHTGVEFFEMGRYLVVGALIAALLQTVVPRPALLALGQGPLISAVALMGLAVVLSICSTVDAFVALAFANSFMPGALLAFLVFGPMIDIKSVLMLGSTFRRGTVIVIALLAFQAVLLAAVLINIYLP